MIMVEHGGVRKLAKAFNVSEAMISLSLRGKRTGELAKKIRHVAKEQYGGVEMQAISSENRTSDIKDTGASKTHKDYLKSL